MSLSPVLAVQSTSCPASTQSHASSGPTFVGISIRDLPNELLDEILKISMRTEPCSSSSGDVPKSFDTETTLALARVSWRFNAIATPVIYSRLIVYCSVPMTRRGAVCLTHTKLLLRSLRENPSLRSLCRRLAISIVTFINSKPEYAHAREAVELLTATEELTIQGSWEVMEDPASDLIQQALQSMPSLTALNIASHAERVHLKSLVGALGHLLPRYPSLKRLSISGLARSDHTEAKNKIKELASSVHLTHLDFYAFMQRPEVLKDLVSWTQGLETFSLRYVFAASYAFKGLYAEGLHTGWSLGTLGPILEKHRDTLRKIEISNLNRHGLEGFDVSGFRQLETLSLSSDCTGAEFEPLDASLVGNLVAPRMRVFRWNMRPRFPRTYAVLNHFDEQEDQWIRALLEVARERNTLLKTVKIDFSPRREISDGADLETFLYPWDRMDWITEDYAPQGIKVVYNEPTVGRDEFVEYLQGARHRALPRWWDPPEH